MNQNSDIPEKLSADVLSALNSAPIGKTIKSDDQKYLDWLVSRAGMITASNFWKFTSQPKLKADKEAGNLGETSKTYCKEIVSELCGAPRKELDIYQFRWGKKYEPIAVDYYEEKYSKKLTFTGADQKFFKLNDMIGSTPDGIEDEETGNEFKCPEKGDNHVTHLLLKNQEEFKKQLPKYYWQCVGGMLCTGKTKWKFISFHDSFEEPLKMKVLEIKRDDEDIKFLSAKLLKGKKYINEIVNDLKNAC